MAHAPPGYAADDTRLTVPALEYLLTPAGEALRAAAAQADSTQVSAVARLRKRHPLAAVHAALTLAALQPKARRKFPGLPYVWATPEALEQATSRAVARHKAARLHAALGPETLVLDLCCGIGGDTLGWAESGPVRAIDSSEVRAWCARRNALEAGLAGRVEVLCADVTRWPLDPAAPHLAFHLDPARRAAGQRSHAYADLVPGPTFIDALLARLPHGALKLSPAVDFASLPPGHLEVISEEGTVVQAVLWTGQAATALGGPDQRTATVLRRGQAATYTSTPAPPPPPGPARPYVYELDGAYHRAGLAAPFAAHLGLMALNSDAGYLTADSLLDHPALSVFRALATLPFSEKRIGGALASFTPPTDHPLRAGPVEIKTRGGLGLDTDALQQRWSKLTPYALTLLVYRGPESTLATIAERLRP